MNSPRRGAALLLLVTLAACTAHTSMNRVTGPATPSRGSRSGSPPLPSVMKTSNIAVGCGVESVLFVENLVWALCSRPLGAHATVLRIDPSTKEPVGHPILIDAQGATSMTMGAGSLWILDQPFQRAGSKAQPDVLLRVNPATGQVIASIMVGRGGISTVFAAGSVWVANTEDASISRVDPTTNAVTATITVAEGPESVLSGFGSIWVGSDFGNVTLTRIDPATDRTVKTFSGLVSPSFGPKVIWVVGPGPIHGVVERLDPATNALIPGGYSPDVGPAVPIAWGNAVWIGKWYRTPHPPCPPESSCATYGTFEYRRYDPASRTLDGPGFPALGPIQIYLAYGYFWMAAGNNIRWAPISQPA